MGRAGVSSLVDGARMGERGSVVVHVLPRDISRGAQVVARALRDRLDGHGGQAHLILTLFRAPAASLEPDVALDVRPGLLRRVGLSPPAVLKLRRALRTLRPDVVVAHGGEPLKYCAVAMPAGSRLVYYRIGVAADAGTRALRRVLQRRTVRRADQVVAISEDVAREAATLLGRAPDSIEVIPNGRDPDDFTEADHGGEGEVRLVFVGHMESPKRPLWFVEVVRRLTASGTKVHGVMVGGGPLLDEVRHAAAGLPIDVLGRRDDVPSLLASSQVLVSCSQREGMPGVLVEAGMSALPAVTIDVPGVRDVVADGVTGFVVGADVPDPLDALTARCAELVADPALRRTMGTAARHRCVERFSLDTVASRWSQTLRALAITFGADPPSPEAIADTHPFPRQ